VQHTMSRTMNTYLQFSVHLVCLTVLSQRERCQEAFLATRDSLLESLDPQSAKSVIEASSLLGRMVALGYTLLPSAQAQRFRGIGSSTRTNSASRGCDSLQALWGAKPAGTRRDMPQESTLDHGKA
jgi:hypothetical protein